MSKFEIITVTLWAILPPLLFLGFVNRSDGLTLAHWAAIGILSISCGCFALVVIGNKDI